MGFETIDIKTGKGGQAIRIPERLKINDDKVYLKKIGNSLHIIPFHNPRQDLFDSLEGFTPDFMDEREQPTGQHRDSFD